MEKEVEGKIEIVQVFDNNKDIMARFLHEGEEEYRKMDYILFDKDGGLHGNYIYNGKFYIADFQDDFDSYYMEQNENK
jgi:hypothetical protein